MAFRWSTSQIIAEHKTLQATSLAISNDNVHCALTSKREISIINLDSPLTIDKKIKLNSKCEPTATEFNPIDKKLLAVSNTQIIQIYSIEANSNSSYGNSFFDSTNSIDKITSSPSSFTCSSNDCLYSACRGHTRIVTDLNWSPFNNDILVSSSYDNMIYIWDLRDPRRPITSMTSVAGSTQVKWSKISEHTLASCHDGDIRIWDSRKSTYPTHYITAHLSRIYGLDWNPNSGGQFATCSQDGTVKFWDVNSSKGKPDNILNTYLPVWRARFTTFGHGLMTALVPTQLRRSGENNSLWLWSMDCFLQPLHAFVGHQDVVLDFGMRMKSNEDYELISWSKDNSLRIWKVDPQLLQESSNVISDDFTELTITETSENDYQNDFDLTANQRPTSLELDSTKNKSEILLTPDSIKANEMPQTLHEEFSTINEASFSIPNIKIEELNADKRFCVVSATTTITCKIKITFPIGYPNQITPHFLFLEGNHAVSEDIKKHLIGSLQTASFIQVKRNKVCLESCLRHLISSLEKLTGTSTSKTTTTMIELFPSHHYGSYLDASVPFPRTSGARFCASDILVCFGRPPHLEQINAPMESTPRSLSALSGYLLTHYRTTNLNSLSNPSSIQSKPTDDMPSISSFYFKAKKRSKSRGHSLNPSKTSKSHESPNCGPVFVFSVSGILPISRQLAELYVFNTNYDPIKMCEINSKAAHSLGRRDLVQKWNIVKLCAETYVKSNLKSENNLMEVPWALHPFGRNLIHSLIEHSVHKCGDIQTAAMISCVFDENNQNNNKLNAKINSLKTIHSNGNTNSNLLHIALRLLKPGSSPYHTVGSAAPTTPIENISEEWNLISAVETLKRTRSNSWSDFAENDLLILNSKTDFFALNDPIQIDEHQDNIKILDPNYVHLYDWYKLIYSDILFRWHLLDQRAMVLKCVSIQNTNQQLLFHQGIDFASECQNSFCDKKESLSSQPICSFCSKPTVTCSVCRLQVTGVTSHCYVCGHGGHAVHMYEWFSQYEFCPSGCGCNCLNIANPFG